MSGVKFTLRFPPWFTRCPFYLGQHVSAYAAIADQPDQNGAVHTAEALRALADGDRYVYDEERQALIYSGPLTADMVPEGYAIPPKREHWYNLLLTWLKN